MARLSKLFALFSHCLSLNHVLASPDHGSHHSLRVRAQPNDPECYDAQYNAPQMTHQNFPPFDSQSAYIYRYRQQQSVNLGSWWRSRRHEAFLSWLYIYSSGSSMKSGWLRLYLAARQELKQQKSILPMDGGLLTMLGLSSKGIGTLLSTIRISDI